MSTPITFLPTDEQRELRTVVRDLLASRATPERVREVMLEHGGTDLTLWKELADLGLTGLLVPERLGGAGASFVELAIVLEEAGRVLASVPLLSSSVLGTSTLLATGDEQALAATLPRVADGSMRLALAHLDAGGSPSAPPGIAATRTDTGWVLTGRSGFVVDGGAADVLVTAASVDDGIELFLVLADHPGVDVTPVPVLDLTRPLAHVRFDDVRVEADARLATDDAAGALAAGVAAGAVALACEQVGAADHVLSTTTAYTKQRVQFGRAIGSFQAVKHRLAEDLVRLEAARSTAMHAARVVAAGDDPDELAIAVPMAKSLCSEMFEAIAADGLQLHGGIGFTWEHEAHLYLKRAKSSKLLLGSPGLHRQRLGDALGF